MANTIADLVNEDALAGKIRENWAHFFNQATESSAALRACTVIPVSSRVTKTTVLSALPHAYWVDRAVNNGRKPVTSAEWENRELHVAELAAVLPVNEEDLEDVLQGSESLLRELVGLLGQAAGACIDSAVLFGQGIPAVWNTDSIVEAAQNAGQEFVVGAAGTEDDLPGSILKAADVLDTHFDPSKMIARKSLRRRLANLRDKEGRPLGMDPTGEFDLVTVRNGAWDPDQATAILLDPSRAIIGIRRDLEVKILDQAVLTLNDGVTQINLAQEDMVAIRIRMRLGFLLGQDILEADGTHPTPVALVKEPAAPKPDPKD